MTKQEEIREGVALRLHTQERALLRVLNESSPNNCFWEELAEFQKDYFRKDADRFMRYLHSAGVILDEEEWRLESLLSFLPDKEGK